MTSVQRLTGRDRGPVDFFDGDALVATREAELRVIYVGMTPSRIEGRLLGGREAARDLPPRQLRCAVPELGGERWPCVVRTDGQIHFLPLEPPGEPGGVREPRRPTPGSDEDARVRRL